MNELDIDVGDFPDYRCKWDVKVEHFLSGFHTPVDRISELNLDIELQGHLLLQQSNHDYYEIFIVICAASES